MECMSHPSPANVFVRGRPRLSAVEKDRPDPDLWL